MESAMPELTMEVGFPWFKMTFDYTEKIAELIPVELLDWRPEDPSGKWSFSLAEIVMHCADARIMFARQMSGSESKDGYWSEGPGEKGIWDFKAYESKQQILDSLQSARAELQQFLDQPMAAMDQTTAGTVKAFENQLKWLKEKDVDTAEAEARGPASLVRVLMAAVCHEAGHRGSLQTLLRLKGINYQHEE